MTDISEHIIEKLQVRKNKKQKGEFSSLLHDFADSNGYSFSSEKGRAGANNLIIGDPESADIIFTAHYDTCPNMLVPNFITPKNIPIYFTYQLLLVALLLALSFIPQLILYVITSNFESFAACVPETLPSLLFFITYFALLLFLMYGPANKHTANDNTSGVVLLLELMHDIPIELRDKVSFVFFDLEERGLVGSKSFVKARKNVAANKLVVNFDCVSDGNNILIVMKKHSMKYIQSVQKAFASKDGFEVACESKGVIYPSDQASFRNGIGVCALKKSKGPNVLYMDRIHTSRDTVFTRENILFLKECSVKLANLVCNASEISAE